MATGKTITEKDTIRTITTHYIDGAFVESHGREVMDIIKPTNGKVIARVTLGDEEDTRRAIAAAKRVFASFSQTTKEERSRYLRQLHKAVSARIDDLTAAMVEEYGGVARFARLIVESGVNAFAAAESALQELPLTRKLGQDDSHPGAGRRCRSDYSLERERAVHLPQAGIGRGGWLYGRHQAERNELAADAGDG